MKLWLHENLVSQDELRTLMALQIEQLGLTPYHVAYDRQMQLLGELHGNDHKNDACLILEHPSVFTLGRNGNSKHISVSKDFLQKQGIEIIKVERGGEVTYHSPGQIVCYPIINLRRSRLRVVEFIHILEEIMLSVVQGFGVSANRDNRNAGIWCGDSKLGSVGIAVRHGISYHGLALNVNMDLEPFSWINACGLTGVSVTSMEKQLQQTVNIKEVETAMTRAISMTFQRQPQTKDRTHIPKPKWLRQRLPSGPGYETTRRLLKTTALSTVCQEARCPNQFECFAKGAATFMLMGENCSRNCQFCAVTHAKPTPLSPEEPGQITVAVRDMGLKYAVLTSVTRDDLPDGGAEHFALTIQSIRKVCPEVLIEILIPDLQGSKAALELVCQNKPTVLNHNIETVPGLYPKVRPQAIYERSLELLARVKKISPDIVTKSGLMLGLGETREELKKTMADIRNSGCDLLTLGQYLQPSTEQLAVDRYVPPEEFENIRETALKLGFSGVAAGPRVRSSYKAGELYALTL